MDLVNRGGFGQLTSGDPTVVRASGDARDWLACENQDGMERRPYIMQWDHR